MEILGLVIFIVIVMAYYGVFGSVETAARMGNRKMERFEAEQIAEDIKFYADEKIKDTDYKTAVSAKEQFKAFRNL